MKRWVKLMKIEMMVKCHPNPATIQDRRRRQLPKPNKTVKTPMKMLKESNDDAHPINAEEDSDKNAGEESNDDAKEASDTNTGDSDTNAEEDSNDDVREESNQTTEEDSDENAEEEANDDGEEESNQNAEEDSDGNDEEESDQNARTPMKMMKKNPMMTPNLTKTLNRRHRGIRLGSRNVMSVQRKTINGEKCVFPFRLGLGTPEEKWYCDCTTGEDRPWCSIQDREPFEFDYCAGFQDMMIIQHHLIVQVLAPQIKTVKISRQVRSLTMLPLRMEMQSLVQPAGMLSLVRRV